MKSLIPPTAIALFCAAALTLLGPACTNAHAAPPAAPGESANAPATIKAPAIPQGPLPVGVPLTINAAEFGAVGDGKADDTEALMKAIEAACSDKDNTPAGRALRRLTIPPGVYRITRSIFLTPQHNNLVIVGTGGSGGKGNTQLLWDGPQDGYLIETRAQTGLQMYDIFLHGNRKAGILLRINSTDPNNADPRWVKKFGQAAATGYHLERVKFSSAGTGIELGGDSAINADCSTFNNCGFEYLKIGFHTRCEQNLSYLFQRADFGYCDTGFYFENGGYVECDMVNAHHVDTMIRIDTGGINAGVYHFSTIRPEQGGKTPGKRPITLMAQGEVNVKFTALQTTCCAVMGDDADLDTPTFLLGPGANVRVESSMICGRIAKLTGDAAKDATFITFENCRFRAGADPRRNIACDDASGYRFVDCTVAVDDPKAREYQVTDHVFIKNLVRYPKGQTLDDKIPR
jgi:hypothetical protein